MKVQSFCLVSLILAIHQGLTSVIAGSVEAKSLKKTNDIAKIPSSTYNSLSDVDLDQEELEMELAAEKHSSEIEHRSLFSWYAFFKFAIHPPHPPHHHNGGGGGSSGGGGGGGSSGGSSGGGSGGGGGGGSGGSSGGGGDDDASGGYYYDDASGGHYYDDAGGSVANYDKNGKTDNVSTHSRASSMQPAAMSVVMFILAAAAVGVAVGAVSLGRVSDELFLYLPTYRSRSISDFLTITFALFNFPSPN